MWLPISAASVEGIFWIVCTPNLQQQFLNILCRQFFDGFERLIKITRTVPLFCFDGWIALWETWMGSEPSPTTSMDLSRRPSSGGTETRDCFQVSFTHPCAFVSIFL